MIVLEAVYAELGLLTDGLSHHLTPFTPFIISVYASGALYVPTFARVTSHRDRRRRSDDSVAAGSNLFDGFLVGSLRLDVNEAKGIGVLFVKV